MADERIDAQEFARVEGLDHWRFADDALHTAYRSGTYVAAAALVGAVAAAADATEHHPDITLRYPGVVHVVLRTHAAGGVTGLDIDLAGVISELAALTGATYAGNEVASP